MKPQFLISILMALLVGENDSANILVTVPYRGLTHYFLMRVLARELLARGHNVTVFAAFKDEKFENHPNYTQLVIGELKEKNFRGRTSLNITDLGSYNYNPLMQYLFDFTLYETNNAFEAPVTKKLLERGNLKFDLILSNMWYQEAFYMLSHKYDAPLILVSSFGNSLRGRYMTRNPLGVLHTPHEYGRWRVPVTLFDKLINIYYFIYEMIHREYWVIPAQEKLARKYFKGLPEPIPTLEQLESESLVMVNAHYSIDGTNHFGQNMVEIGGFHIPTETKDNEMQQDLKDLLDNAPNGFVFLSFGTKANFSEFNDEIHKIFMKAFSLIDQIILIKADTDIPGKPKNVIIRNWLPQNEILAHKNIRLFISHAGLLSMQEAIYHGVPILGMPIFADQHNNIAKAVGLGYAKSLSIFDLSFEPFISTLKQMLENKIYYDTAKEYSSRFRDRPLSALDTAIYWIEYVINQKGTKSLRSPRLEDSWYRYYGLDVTAVIIGILFCFCWVIVKSLAFFIHHFNDRFVKFKIKIE